MALLYGLGFLFNLIIPIGVIVLIGYGIYRWRKRGVRKQAVAGSPGAPTAWYAHFRLSREDGVAQLFFMLGLTLFGLALLAFNQRAGSPLELDTLFLVTSVVGLVGVYVLRATMMLPLTLLAIVWWWVAATVRLADVVEAADVGALVGVMLLSLLWYGVGRAHFSHERFKRLGLIYVLLGLVSVTLILFVLSTRSGLFGLEQLMEGASVTAIRLVSFGVVILAAAAAGVNIYAASRESAKWVEAVGVVVLVLLFAGLAFIPAQDLKLDRTSSLTETGVLWAALFNTLIFVELVGIILLGFVRREVWMINYGALFMFLLIAVKYFDWFFSFLDKSVFFISAGVLLLLLGWGMERGRRYMIAQATHSGGSS